MIREQVVRDRTPLEFGHYQAVERDTQQGTWLQRPHERICAGYFLENSV